MLISLEVLVFIGNISQKLAVKAANFILFI